MGWTILRRALINLKRKKKTRYSPMIKKVLSSYYKLFKRREEENLIIPIYKRNSFLLFKKKKHTHTHSLTRFSLSYNIRKEKKNEIYMITLCPFPIVVPTRTIEKERKKKTSFDLPFEEWKKGVTSRIVIIIPEKWRQRIDVFIMSRVIRR